MVFNTRQIGNATTFDQNNRMLLQIVTFLQATPWWVVDMRLRQHQFLLTNHPAQCRLFPISHSTNLLQRLLPCLEVQEAYYQSTLRLEVAICQEVCRDQHRPLLAHLVMSRLVEAITKYKDS